MTTYNITEFIPEIKLRHLRSLSIYQLLLQKEFQRLPLSSDNYDIYACDYITIRNLKDRNVVEIMFNASPLPNILIYNNEILVMNQANAERFLQPMFSNHFRIERCSCEGLYVLASEISHARCRICNVASCCQHMHANGYCSNCIATPIRSMTPKNF